MSRRDGGLWEDVSGRKHVVVAIYRIRGVEDVDNLFVPRALSAVWLSHGGILGSKESAWSSASEGVARDDDGYEPCRLLQLKERRFGDLRACEGWLMESIASEYIPALRWGTI